jgi:hypothetical protein
MIQQPSLCSPQLHIQRGICEVKPLGKLHKVYLLRYIVVAKSIRSDERKLFISIMLSILDILKRSAITCMHRKELS